MKRPKVREICVATVASTLSIEEAAVALGITPSEMEDYLSRGLFTTLKFKDFKLIDPEEVKRWQREHYSVGKNSGPA